MGIDFVDGPRPANMTDLEWAEERAARMAVVLGRPLSAQPEPMALDQCESALFTWDDADAGFPTGDGVLVVRNGLRLNEAALCARDDADFMPGKPGEYR